jgi:ADP-heptose:LPS heptosyltransferase
MPNIPQENSPAWLGSVRKILVIQLAPFGDVLLTTSYFESLKERMPRARIYYLVKEPYHKIVENHPFIDRILVLKKRSGIRYVLERLRLFKRIHDLGFDLVIDQQNLPSTQEMTLFSGAKHRLGYEDERFRFVYNLRAKRGKIEYSASERFSILGPLGITRRKYRLYFTVPAGAARTVDSWLAGQKLPPDRLVCISPGSPMRRKKWRLEHYSRLADLIQKRLRYRVILLWGPKELEDARTVLRLMRTEAILAPPTDLQHAAALIKRCRLLVCNDGGLNHLAATTQTPTLAVFGTTHPEYWSPAGEYSDRHTHLFNPDADSSADDSFGISPETAFAEARKIIKRHSRKGA